MTEASRKSPRQTRALSYRIEPDVRELLDHIAKELAAEYVRLMRDAHAPGPESAKAPPNVRKVR